MVSIQFNGSHQCGGSIISETKVLTAAHCLHDVSPEDLTLVFGTYLLSKRTRTSEERKAASFNVHPKYEPPKVYYDLAIIEVDLPLVFGISIHPICLPLKPTDVDSKVSISVIVAGWGRTDRYSNLSNELRSVSLTVYGQAHCNRSHDWGQSIYSYQVKQNMPNLFQSSIMCAASLVILNFIVVHSGLFCHFPAHQKSETWAASSYIISPLLVDQF